MKKHTKLIAILLATTLLAALMAACGGTSSSSAPAVSSAAPAASTASGTASSAPASTAGGGAKSASDVKVALVCGGAINDGGWNAAAYEGLKRIENELGCTVAYTEKVPVAEMPQVLRTYARQGYNLIFGHGSQFGEPMTQVAPEFPEVTFVPVNANASGENLSGTVFKFGENGYFCGMAAAMVSETGKVGAIAPDDAPNNTADIKTFEMGAKSINPDIEVSVAYTGSWDDLPKAKEAAESLISKDCDVLFTLGDAYAVAVYQACESAGIKSIGWVSDQRELSDTLIMCGLQSVANVYVGTTQRYIDGTMEEGFQVYGMADGAQGLSELYGLNEEQAAQIDQAVQDYLDGKLEIPTLY